MDLSIEANDSREGIRFVINFPKETILIWDATKFIHDEAISQIDKRHNYDKYKWEDNLWGVAKVVGGKLEFDYSDEVKSLTYDKTAKIKSMFIKKWKGKDDWTKTYFTEPIIAAVEEWGENWNQKKYLEDWDREKYLGEEYLTSFKNDYGLVKNIEVFKNPTAKEIRDVSKTDFSPAKELRFMVDFDDKILYIFSVDTIHAMAYLKAIPQKTRNEKPSSEFMFWAVAKDIGGGKLKLTSCDTLQSQRKPLIKYKGKDDWTKKWFGKPIIDLIVEKWGTGLLKEKYEISKIHTGKVTTISV